MADTRVTVVSRLDRDNPWPGLDSFAEGDRAYFHGRDTEAAELHARVQRETLTVLFGRSGLGKTSLLNAGLFPSLRDEDLLPVYIRLDHSHPAATAEPRASLRAQVLAALTSECARHEVEAPAPAAGETLWEFFHRNEAEFWSARNRPVTPVLVFDQFEELFTVGQGDRDARERCEAFIAELGDLIENRVPAAFKARLDNDAALGRHYDFRARNVKLIVSFREDFLAAMEGLKSRVPSLMHNRFRLQPMTGVQANEVISLGGSHLVDALMARRIIGLAGRGVAEPPPAVDELPNLEIDPALLSVVCSELNVKRQRLGESRIGAHLLQGAEREILSDFYERGFEGLDARVRVFVEDNLLTASGFRNSYAREDALAQSGVTAEALNTLVARRLVREEERLGVRRLELTHDILTGVVRDSRDTRRTREAEAAAALREREAARKQRRNRIMTAALAFGFAGLLAAGWYVGTLISEVGAQRKNVLALKDTTQKLQLTAAAQAKRAEQLKADAQAASREAAAQAGRANQMQSEAQAANKDAQARLLEAESARAAAKAAQAQADSSQREAAASRTQAGEMLTEAWFARVLNTVERMGKQNSDLALLLINQASRVLKGLEVQGSLHSKLQGIPNLSAYLHGARGSINHIAVSPGGKTIASGAFGNAVILWDAATRTRIATLEGHKNSVRHVAFSPNGNTRGTQGRDTPCHVQPGRKMARLGGQR